MSSGSARIAASCEALNSSTGTVVGSAAQARPPRRNPAWRAVTVMVRAGAVTR